MVEYPWCDDPLAFGEGVHRVTFHAPSLLRGRFIVSFPLCRMTTATRYAAGPYFKGTVASVGLLSHRKRHRGIYLCQRYAAGLYGGF